MPSDEAASSSVWPSGAALATYSDAIMVPAPGLFSTSTGWPRRLCSRSASRRDMMSAAPPGENGTTSVTGLVG
ncbi:hypothetical protein FQZ97_572330 [compost metagenome]